MWNRSRQLSVVGPWSFGGLRCSMRQKIATAASAPSIETAASSPPSREGTSMYGARGYDFVEGFYAMGPNAAVSRLRANLSLYGLLGFTAVTVIVYYTTTRGYTLSTCPYHPSDARYKVFSSDYAVLRNRWSGKEHVVELSNNGELAVVTRRISVNWLIYSVRLYLHATESIIVVDVEPELSVNRFVRGDNRRFGSSITTTTTTTTAIPSQFTTTKDEGNDSGLQIVFHCTIRPLAVRNGYQKGTLPLYERRLETVVRELLTERYRSAILLQAETGLPPGVTEELLQNGQLRGADLSGMKVIGNPAEFADEVQRRVQKKMGDQVMWRTAALYISRSAALQVSKKNLRLKCGTCRRLLPAAHFNKTTAPSHSLVCVDCKRLCVLCGLQLTLDHFTDASTEFCDCCLAKRHVARENVYFRYPVLKYRSCPFSVDQMREEIRRENPSR